MDEKRELDQPTTPKGVTTRRRFLAGAGVAGLTGVVAAATWEPLVAEAARPAERLPIAPVTAGKHGSAIFSALGPTDPHLFGENFALVLGSEATAALVSGGRVAADVVVEKVGPDHIQRKHLGQVKFEEITLEAGLGLSPAFKQWIHDVFDLNFTRRNGAIIGGDFNHKEISRVAFFNALISEIGFPALDAASKDAAKMTIKIAPERTRHETAAGGVVPTGAGKGQTKWLVSNFRLEIDRLDTTRVSKIDAIKVHVHLPNPNPPSNPNLKIDAPDFQSEPAHLELSNIKVMLAASHAQTWLDWHEDFVIRGNNGRDTYRNGTLIWLNPDLATELGRIELRRLGIFGLGTEPGTSNVVAELFVEQLSLKLGGAPSLPAVQK